MFLIGGRSGSNLLHLNDVWRSADGENWDLVTATAAFSGRGYHQAVSYGGSLWVIGGWYGNQYRDDVWRSSDGENWFSVPASGGAFFWAEWAIRRFLMVGVFG